MLSTEPVLINSLLHEEDDLIYEVRLLITGSKGRKLFDHWFYETRDEAILKELQLKQKYCQIHDNVVTKVQPHILR